MTPKAWRLAAAAVAAALATPAAGARPLVFERNVGQAGPEVVYLSRGRGFSLLIGHSGAELRLAPPPVAPGRPGAAPPAAAASEARIRISAGGVPPAARLEGVDPLSSRSHYLIGADPRRWMRDVPHFGRVRQRGVAPGVDLEFYGTGEALEYDLILEPGGDPASLDLQIDGAQRLALAADGSLVLDLGEREIRQSAPVAYQESRGGRRPVPARYVLRGGTRVGLELGGRDPGRPVVIDPVITYSTFLGGSAGDFGRDIAVDSAGYAYVTGQTSSPDLGGPRPPPGLRGPSDVFVARIAPDGATLAYVTYLGGSGEEAGRAIAVDPAGNVYVAGETSSTDFPVRGAFQAALRGEADAFVLKLDPSGSSLVYSSYLGGQGMDSAGALAVDPMQSAILLGQTTSPDFPVLNAVQTARAGGLDAFVVKVAPSGQALAYSTYLGGSGDDLPLETTFALALDALGGAIVCGTTESTDFPVVSALQATHGGGLRDAFLARLHPSGAPLLSSTYIGRGAGDTARGVALDALGNIYLGGATRSYDFPLRSPLQAEKGVLYDAFVMKLDPGAQQILYSTFLGGSGPDAISALAVDRQGNAYVAGETESSDFPVVAAPQPRYAGLVDGFVAKITPTGSALVYSTYLGGTQLENPFMLGIGLDVDRDGSAYVTGTTASPDFPLQRALQPAIAGVDAYVTRISAVPAVQVQILQRLGGARLGVRVRNPGPLSEQVQLKVWIESPSGGILQPVSTGLPAVLSLKPGDDIAASPDAPLPAGLPFPGTLVGARLLNPASGRIVAESVCTAVPCR